MIGRLRRWNDSLDDPVDVRAFAVLRIALGPIVLLHLRPFLRDALEGVMYRDRFWVPYADWYPQLPPAGYFTVLVLTSLAAIALACGWHTRAAAWLTTLGIAYNLFASQTHFHHNRAFLVILLLGVSVLPTGRTVSIDAWRARRRGTPLRSIGGSRLALLVLRIEIAVVYGASGSSKLIDSDWFGGTVTRLRVVEHRGRLDSVGVPDAVIDLLSDPTFHWIAAKVIVATELFLAIGLMAPATRRAAIWVAVVFHVSIQATAAVQVFSWAALAALVVWIDGPSPRYEVAGPTRSLRAIQLLDWTGRFSIVGTDSVLVVRDGGSVVLGSRASWFVLGRLPATFWLAAPIELVLRRRGPATGWSGSR